jgi:sigma-E factor negative regulatory protein RseA
MNSEVSALMDGELDKKSSDRLMARLNEDEEIRNSWSTYHLIGDALRQQPLYHFSLQDKILQSLAEESGPQPARTASRPFQYGIAAVALVATASIVAVLVTRDTASGTRPDVMGRQALPTGGSRLPIPALNPATHVDEYLLAHQEFSPSVFPYRHAEYLRSVAYDRDSNR